ncbi:hypothetical protein [Micromonospora sp. NPDC005305]|uniref:hypothetical protein n=1 Tax=Micromonospora sp. NPDC005305 TaxID=3156875 RepID=UPI0033BA7EBD
MSSRYPKALPPRGSNDRRAGNDRFALGALGEAIIEAQDERQTGDRRYLAKGGKAQISVPAKALASELIAADQTRCQPDNDPET